MSVALHGKQAQEATVLIDTTLQEKNITSEWKRFDWVDIGLDLVNIFLSKTTKK
jgi:hypothetical protein